MDRKDGINNREEAVRKKKIHGKRENDWDANIHKKSFYL